MKELGILVKAEDQASGILQGIVGSINPMTLAIKAAAAALIGVGAAALSMSRDTDKAMGLLQAQTGITDDELEGMRDTATSVFKEGFGENIGDVTESMTYVHKSLGLTGDDLEDVTKKAITVSDVFGVDVEEGVSIAASAVKSGLAENSEEAFDIITKGFQMGLDQGGDFGDTINEYSGDFQRMGFDAEQTLALINAGLDEGAHNTDVIADGVREFGIRFGAAESNAVEAMDSIGINTDELFAKYEAGELTAADAMNVVTSHLQNVESDTLRAEAGAALFGSKWEDVGGDVFMAAGQAQGGIEGIAGATDKAGESINQGFGPAMERFKRTVLVALLPLGDAIGGMIDAAIPYLERFAVWLEENIPVGIQKVKEIWNTVWPVISTALTTAWGIIEPIFNNIQRFAGEEGPSAFQGFRTAIQPVIDWFTENWPLIQETVETVLNAANAVIQAVLGQIQAYWQAHGQQVLAGVENVWNIIKTVIGTTVMTILDLVKVGMQLLTGDTEGAMETLKGIFDRAKEAVVTIFRNLMDLVRNAFSHVDWGSLGRSIIDGVARGISGAAGKIKDAAKNAARDAFNAAKSLLGIGSPSKLFEREIGMPIPEGAAIGIEKNAHLMQRAFNDAAPEPSSTGTGRSYGPVVIHNHFGRDSIRSYEDILDLADKISRSVRLKTGALEA